MMTILMAVAMLTVLLLLSIPAGIAVPLSSFYSYGSEANDTRLSPTDDGSSSAISLPASFQFFGSYYSTIYVSHYIIYASIQPPSFSLLLINKKKKTEHAGRRGMGGGGGVKEE